MTQSIITALICGVAGLYLLLHFRPRRKRIAHGAAPVCNGCSGQMGCCSVAKQFSKKL